MINPGPSTVRSDVTSMGAKQSVKRWGKIIVVGGLWSTESLLESFNGDRSVSKVHTFTIDGERFRVLVKSDLSPENALKLHIRSHSGLKLYSGNVGVMLPYDVTDEASFEAVKRLGIHPDPFLKRVWTTCCNDSVELYGN